MDRSYLSLVRTVSFEEAGIAFRFFRSLPEVDYRLTSDTFSIFAYLDEDHINLVNIEYNRIREEQPEVSLISLRKSGPNLVDKGYEENFPNTGSFYFPKEIPIRLSYATQLFRLSEGRNASVNNTTIVVSSPEKEDREKLQLLLNRIHMEENEGKRFNFLPSSTTSPILSPSENREDLYFFHGIPYRFE